MPGRDPVDPPAGGVRVPLPHVLSAVWRAEDTVWVKTAGQPRRRAGVHSRRPFAAALACLVAGFAAMALLSLVSVHSPGGRSMWTYWSGTLGDLTLPVIVYGLTRTCVMLGPERISPGSYAAAGLGAIIGTGSQAAWLADPNPRLNWLLVAPHTFSFPGWYHAVYLVITAAYVAGTAWEALRRMGRAPRSRLSAILAGPGAAAMMSACGIFVLTIVADSLPSASTSSSQSTIAITAATPALLLALAAWRLGRATALLFRPIACALAITGIGVLLISAGR
jgi:hypothetical protein